MTVIKIAQLQLPVPEDKADAVAQMEEVVASISEDGIDLVALPEMFACPYDIKNFPIYAEEEQGSTWKACSELARKHHIYLSAGSMPERDGAGRVFNTAYVFDREGRQIAKHRKVHLFDIDIEGGQSFKESETLTAGDSITTFETEFGTFGLCVCYDFRFPELGRLMALNGAEVVLVPAAFNMTTGPAHWKTMFLSQALNNQFFAVGTAPARDMTASYTSWGHSIVATPWGQPLQEMDEKQGVQITELDLDQVSKIRDQLPLLKHRRTDIYTLKENAKTPINDK